MRPLIEAYSIRKMQKLFGLKSPKLLFLLSSCVVLVIVRFILRVDDHKQHNTSLSSTSPCPASKTQDEIHIDIGVDGALDQFYPLRLTECSFSTPRHYAPCQARSMKHVAVAEELIYPAFSLNPPIFATSRPQDVQRWWNTTWMLWDRAYKIDERLRYPEKHGQIFVCISPSSVEL